MIIDSEPLVSVVTPVYNGEKYLAECIESVLVQTYKNWEYIIVNNCSTDNTLEVAQKYAQKDARIRVHNNKEFFSLFENHNHALLQISDQSKYCKMLQSDDMLLPECLTEMVKLAEGNPVVGMVSSYRLNGDWVSNGLPYPTTIMSGREICRSCLLGGPDVFGPPTAILIRSDLIRGRKAFFNARNKSADKEVEYDILQYSDFGFVHQILTYSRVHKEQESSFYYRYNVFLPGKIYNLKKYGPVYLSNEEYEKRLNEMMRSYYRFLGKSVYQLRGNNFWKYHKDAFKSMGDILRLTKLIKAVFLELLDILLNPKNTAERIIHKVYKRENSEKRINRSGDRMYIRKI